MKDFKAIHFNILRFNKRKGVEPLGEKALMPYKSQCLLHWGDGHASGGMI